MSTRHVPILVEPIVEALKEPFLSLLSSSPSSLATAPRASIPHWIVDCTLGGGGHTQAFLDLFASDSRLAHHKVLALDQDASAVAQGKIRFEKELAEGRIEILHCRFGESSAVIAGRPVLGLLADLGFSSDQIEDMNRGLSFQSEGPLDMRLDQTRGISCRQLLEQAEESELERIFSDYGGERFSRRIAQSLVRLRANQQLPSSPKELALAIVKALPAPARHGRIHAATRCFQALRIQLNDEMGELDRLLAEVLPSILPGGRAAILSFHSLEDRRVKHFFKDPQSHFKSLTKKPLQASEQELQQNPRSRSAKLRVGVRCTAEL